jgi:hypothetical protein
MMSVASQKCHPLNVDFGQGQLSQIRRIWQMVHYCQIVIFKEIIDQNRLVCWSIVVKENPTVLHFRGCFVLTPSLR